MNRLIIIIGTLLLVSTIRAQTVTGSRIELTSPSPKIVFNSESAGQTIDNDGTNNGWPGFLFNAYDQAGGPLVTKWSIVYSARDNYLYFYDYSHNRRAFELKDDGNMVFNPFGSVGIGTTATGSHKLAVEGSIGAREIKVEASGWSDFVFENNYELRTLEEVEEHIAEKGHLPEIPSEAEVTENGINLGEMNAKLLQKIEELTLYLIEQNKENQEQRKLIEELQKEVSALKTE